MIAFGIHCSFFIVLPFQIKTCSSNVFFFTRENVLTRKIGPVSEVLRARLRPIGIGCAICPDLLSETPERRVKRKNYINFFPFV